MHWFTSFKSYKSFNHLYYAKVMTSRLLYRIHQVRIARGISNLVTYLNDNSTITGF